MKNKSKKKLKKKDRQKVLNNLESQTETSVLRQKIKQLEKQLKKRESLIEELRGQLKKSKTGKEKKKKPGDNPSNPLFSGQTDRVGVAQRKAWQRHEYLRDRYELHLAKGQDKGSARSLADKDLREKYGEEAGYTEQQLEQILS